MPLGFPFDWKNPDYIPVIEERIERLNRLRADPDKWVPILSHVYKHDPAQCIIDWGITTDPRNPEIGLPTTLPFLLFPHQEAWVHWLMERWQGRENGITEKTREMGASWLAVATSCVLCLFRDGMTIGFGSRKEEYVDKIDFPKSLFWKARQFMMALPRELTGGWSPAPDIVPPRPWNIKTDAPHMRILFPHRNSYITGECGTGIGRGDRTGLYFVDESAFLEHPEETEFSLSRTTNCRIDISTPNGMANPFAQKRWSGKMKPEQIFSYHWRQDPRKDEQWYEAEKLKLDNPLVVARELDINYADSIEGVVIPSEWFQAAIGAIEKLGIEATGARSVGFDVADEGTDKNAQAGRYGILLESLEEWSGKGGDIFKSVERVMGFCDVNGIPGFVYDADGLGAGCRGDARVINEQRKIAGKQTIRTTSFQGSGAVWNPDAEMVPKRKNKDFFANLKAQSWWALRLRFQATYRAVHEGMEYDADDLISINPNLKNLVQLQMQMQQPTYSINGIGKILIDKMPDGTKSPNLADAVMIAFNPATRAMEVWAKLAGRAA